MTDPRPAPYPPDTRAKGWRFELDYERIEQSDTWAMAKEVPMAQPALLLMWLAAWRQIPCGSLPNDEDVIRARCGLTAAQWKRMRAILMRGWWAADDGRLYHTTITERVQEMLYARSSGAHRKHFAEVAARDGRRCRYCGCTDAPLTLDHVFPRSRGGSDGAENLALACRPCNSSKGAKTPEEWQR